MIDIKDLNKGDVLHALFHASHTQGRGFMDPAHDRPLSEKEARAFIASGYTEFEYLRGRVLKVDLSGDAFDPSLFDRDNGEGAAARAVNALRNRP